MVMQTIWMILDVWNMKPAMEYIYVYIYNVHEIQTLKHVWLVVLTILKNMSQWEG